MGLQTFALKMAPAEAKIRHWLAFFTKFVRQRKGEFFLVEGVVECFLVFFALGSQTLNRPTRRGEEAAGT